MPITLFTQLAYNMISWFCTAFYKSVKSEHFYTEYVVIMLSLEAIMFKEWCKNDLYPDLYIIINL